MSSMSIQKEIRYNDTLQVSGLETRRNQILHEIHSEGDWGHLQKEAIEALKDEYNRLSQELDNAHCGPSTDPLAILPPEIWTDILREATSENSEHTSPTGALLSICFVSKRWSTKILDTPMLWTVITIGYGEADAQAKLETALYLSRDLPLKLRIIFLSDERLEGVPLLQPHANRVEEIVFLNDIRPDPASIQCSRYFDQILSSLGPLCSLKTVHCPPSWLPNWNSLFANCPTLQYIYGYGVDIPFDVLQNPDGGLRLRGYSTAAPLNDILAHLEDLAHVERLIWVVYIYNDTKAGASPVSITSFPALHEIWSFDSPNANFFAILKLCGNLKFLAFSVQDRWQHLYDLFALFPSLPCLQHLELRFEAYTMDNLTWPVMEPTRTRVQILVIRHFDNNDSSIDKNHEAFFHTFPLYFSDVIHFTLEHTYFGPSAVRYIHSATHLLSLRLMSVRLEPKCDISLDTPSMEVLHWTGNANVLGAIISGPKCPSLLKLLIYVSSHFEVMYGWDNPVYSQIICLETNLSRRLSNVPSFDALQNLQLQGPDISTTGIVINLILQPDACPKLKEIGLAFIPEWDLLIIMLEQRNFLPKSQGIAQIDTLTFPSPIPPHILTPLTALLGGRLTKRPSNRDLSFCGFMEAYFDLSIPGCHRCHRSMRPCSRPAYRSFMGSFELYGTFKSGRVIFHGMDLPLKRPDVPLGVWEWLQKRETRLAEWNVLCNTGAKSEFRREDICLEMKLAPQPFVVTAHSITGLV